MNIEIRRVTPQTWAVIANGTHWRRFNRKADAEELADNLRRDPIIFKSDLEKMRHPAHCKVCGNRFEYIAGVKNSTRGGYPDFNEWPRCPSCGSYTETTFEREV